MKAILTTLTILLTLTFQASAHCQIPCGIFDDQARIHEMEEHVATIEKSIREIKRLSAEETPDQNQIVRWINNKDMHADELTEIVTYYFLAQRIKLTTAEEKYVDELKTLHAIMIHAMKSKQSLDLQHTEKLLELIHQFEHIHLGTDHTH